MNKLEQKMYEFNDMPNDVMDKIQQEFEKQNNFKLSTEAMQDLQQMQKSSVSQNQQKLSQNMKSMNKQFHNLQAAIQSMNQMKTFTDMIKILDDMILLSKNQ